MLVDAFSSNTCSARVDSSASLLSMGSSKMGECGRALPVATGFCISRKTCLDWSHATASAGACFAMFLDSPRGKERAVGDSSKCTL